jgi:ribonuclease HI
MIEAWFDGAVQPHNPGGHGGYGIVIKRNSVVIHSDAVYVGRWPSLSNNCVEYAGCIAVLRYFIRENISRAVVYGDANLVVKQITGHWKVKNGAYVPYFHEAHALKAQLPEVVIVWIPREQNGEADELSKRAVTQRPSTIGFQLDPGITPLPLPKVKNYGQRRREQIPQVSEDEALEMFRARYGHL